jgi:hypothetical protein
VLLTMLLLLLLSFWLLVITQSEITVVLKPKLLLFISLLFITYKKSESCLAIKLMLRLLKLVLDLVLINLLLLSIIRSRIV